MIGFRPWAALAAIWLVGIPAQAELIANGGFETGDLTDWTISGNTDFVFVSSENPHSGTYSLHLGPAGTPGFLTQSFATSAGMSYRLTYQLFVEPGTPNLFETTVNGNTVFARTNLPAQPFTAYSFIFAGVNGMSTLQFGYQHDPSHFFLDDISVVPFFGFGSGLTPNQQAVGDDIDRVTTTTSNFSQVTGALTGVSASQIGAALDQLSPLAFAQFTSVTAFNNASFETEAMDNYLAGQRRGPQGTFMGGNGRVDASGLTMNDPSYDPNLAVVHSRMLAWNPAPIAGTVSDVANPLLGGMDTKDSKDMKAMDHAEYTNPWNFFVRGNVILAQGFSSPNVSHFDDNTESVVLGTDYRLTPNFLVGLTAGYGHTDVTLDNNGSSATVDSYSPGLYASYASGGWYANASGNYTHNAYTQNRAIGFLGQAAESAPEGNQGTANLDGGYEFHHGALTFGPLAGLQYTHLTVDGYDENGSIADLSVGNDQSDSLRSRLGGRLSFAFSHCGMNFTPHLQASWQHEFMDQSRGVTSQFEGVGPGTFSVRTDDPSRDSALVSAGFDAEINRTVSSFADYTVQAGAENYFGQSIQAGVKIGF